MQFNPIFFPANSSADFVSRNDIKAMHDAKYLFSDLVKVTGTEEASEEFSKYFNKNEVKTSETSDVNYLEFDYDDPDEELLSRELTEEISPSLVTVISSLVETIEKNISGSADGNFVDEQIVSKHVKIINVDEKALADFIQQVKSNGGKLLSIKQSVPGNLGSAILLKEDLSGMENLKQTNPGAEAIFEELNKNSKVDLEVNNTAELQKYNNNSVKNVTLQNIGQDNRKIVSVNNEMKLRINNSINDLFHTLEPASTNDLSKAENSKQNSIVNGINKISIEVINSRTNTTEPVVVSNSAIKPQNTYKVLIELSPRIYENNNDKLIKNSFLPGNNIKSLLQPNDNLNHLRAKLTDIFIDVEHLNVTKTQPDAASAQVVTSNKEKEALPGSLKKMAVNSSASTEGKNASEIKSETIELENDKDPNSRKNEQQNTGKNIAGIKSGDNLQAKNSLNNSQTKLFAEQGLIQNGKQIFDDVKEIVQSKIGADTSKLKLANKTDVIDNILKSIQNKENKSIEIKLNPPELGKLKVILDFSKEKISLRMNVENETAKQLINNNIGDLKKELILAGIQLEDVQVSVTGGEREENFSNRNNKRSSAKETLTNNEPHTGMSVKMMGYNTYDYII